MKLSECLNTADTATLRAIADHYSFACSRHSKLALLQEILFSFGNRSFLAAELPHWYEGRERAMLRLCLDPRKVFPVEELEGIFAACSTSADTISCAVQEGWLYPTTRLGGRLLYCIPEELHPPMRAHVVDGFARQIDVTADGPLTFREESQGMARDLDVFLEYVRHHDVRLTSDGAMYKRNLQQILELLEVPELPLQGGWRFGYGRRFHDYPDRFALIYDYAYQQHFLEEREDATLSVTAETTRWLQASEADRLRALVKFYLNSYRRPITRLPLIVQLIAHVAVQWVRSASMLTAISDLVNAYYYDDQQQVWESRILSMLTHLGLLRHGRDDQGEGWFQITKLGQQLLTPDAFTSTADDTRERQRILIVQPNFDIVVTADQPLITAELAIFAELRQTGVVRVYRITEESVRHALESGCSHIEWLEYLQTHSQTPVPGNVERTLMEWARSFRAADGSVGL